MGTFSTDFATSPIKSVQRGVTNLDTSTSSLGVTISAVNMTKAVCSLLGFTQDSNGGPSTFPRIALTTSTNLQITRQASASTNAFVSWEVVEFN